MKSLKPAVSTHIELYGSNFTHTYYGLFFFAPGIMKIRAYTSFSIVTYTGARQRELCNQCYYKTLLHKNIGQQGPILSNICARNNRRIVFSDGPCREFLRGNIFGTPSVKETSRP
jgi:hypothetical protein